MSATIVVPSRGGAARLPILLKSLGPQERPEVEMIVLDGDIDDSGSVVRRFGDVLPNALVRVGSALAAERAVGIAGRTLNRTIGVLRAWPAEKLVAFAIRSAAHAGRRYPGRVRTRL